MYGYLRYLDRSVLDYIPRAEWTASKELFNRLATVLRGSDITPWRWPFVGVNLA